LCIDMYHFRLRLNPYKCLLIISIERPNSELETGLFLLFSFLPLRSPKVSRYSLGLNFGVIL